MLDDLVSLITLFLVRGANTKKLSDAVLGRYHDDGVYQDMHRLISIYKVAEKPASSRRAITLPRLSLSFPTIALKITVDLLVCSRERHHMSGSIRAMRCPICLRKMGPTGRNTWICRWSSADASAKGRLRG